MSMWNQLKNRTQSAQGGGAGQRLQGLQGLQGFAAQLKTRADQYRSREFAEASMAMCALVASADGAVDATERQRTAALITSNDTLAVFPPDQLRTTFDGYCDKLTRDADFGRIEAIAAIAKLSAKPDQARAVISIGLIIGHADGDVSAPERRAVTDACHAVGLPPADFDL